MTFNEWYLGLTNARTLVLLNDKWALAEAAFDYQQAQIDKLMLEYCPDEMTESQRRQYEQHQRTAPETAAERDRLKEINAELLEAGEEAIAELDDCCAVPSNDWDFYEKLRAAIYKAKDRTEQKENQQ